MKTNLHLPSIFQNSKNVIVKAISMLFVLFSFNSGNGQAGNALNFDGANDRVDLPFVVSGSYTKEAWINLSNLSAYNNFISGNGTAFWAPEAAGAMYGSKLTAGHGGGFNDVQDPTSLLAGVWYHVAVTYDAGTGLMTLYKNGIAVASNTVGGYTETVQYIGAFNDGASVNYVLDGTMDEVRVWDKALTAVEIAAQMSCAITGSEPGLLAYYDFNQGTAAGDNTGITTLIDKSGANNGTLVNFSLTPGATSNFVLSGATITGNCPALPVEITYFNLVKGNNNVKLSWQTSSEHNNIGFEIERSFNGTANWQRIAYVKGALNSSRTNNYSVNDFAPLKGNNYYRLKQIDADRNSKYSAVKSIHFGGTIKPIVIYPTVTNNILIIEIGDNVLLNTELLFVDLSGKVVKKQLITKLKQEVSVSALPIGMYVIKTINGEGGKFVKQ